MNLLALRRTAAEITASAVFELYPDIELWGGGETSTGFFYDLYFPHPLHLHQIEERMRQIVKERRPVRVLEMVPFSARELLKKEGHLARVAELEDWEEDLVEIVQIGSFHDLSRGPHLKNTAEMAAFRLKVETLEGKGIRLYGECHYSKEGLKKFLKKLDRYRDPKTIGEERGFWIGEIWLKKGMDLRSHLCRFLKKNLFPEAIEVETPKESEQMELFRSLGREVVMEIRSQNAGQTLLTATFFNQSEKKCSSCLQSIAKTLTILGFDHSSVPNGKGVDYLVEDELDRPWVLVGVKKISGKNCPGTDIVITVEVEKVLFLLLEKNLNLQVVEH